MYPDVSLKQARDKRDSTRRLIANGIDPSARIFRARVIAQTAAKLLHEFYLSEKHEPDIGCVLDVVSDLLEASIAGLDRMTLNL